MANWRKTDKEMPEENTVVFVGISESGSRDYKSDQVGIVLFADGKFGNGSWTHWMHPPRIPKARAKSSRAQV